MLSGPTLNHHRTLGELSRIRVLLDVSNSMATIDKNQEKGSRLNRAIRFLFGDASEENHLQGLMNELMPFHRIELIALSNTEADQVVWSSETNAPIPTEESITSNGTASALGEFIQRSMVNAETPPATNKLAAIVLISDGQSNKGITLQDAAERIASEKVPIYTIGVGNVTEPEDLGIVRVEHSQRVYRTDRLSGTILLKERMKSGTIYRVSISHLGKELFGKELRSTDEGTRRIEFDLAAEPIFDESKRNWAIGPDRSALPIELDFSIHCDSEEISISNNRLQSSLWGIDRKNRILLLDRRGGWEMRYIKNAMERDPLWELTAIIGQAAFSQRIFPDSRNKLFEFDLMLASLDSLRECNITQQTWISDFVSVSGGGLILIDSNRERSSQETETVLSQLLPVKPIDRARSEVIRSIRISSSARNQPALQFGTNENNNDQLWSRLPPPKSFRDVTLEPGAESLIETVATGEDQERRTLSATKMFGQGRVVYFASDESWRWRYKVADLYHQRFWNQIAAWVMRAPFSVNDSFASLDSGIRNYSSDESITIRAKLKQDDSSPFSDAPVQMILERDGERYASIPLLPEPDARGFYKSTIGPLPPGNYSIRLEAVGIPTDALRLQSEFVVLPPTDIEIQTLACDQVALTTAAKITGGEFTMLEEAKSLAEKLAPRRTGRVIESQTILSQSFPWFAIIVGLLAIEWYLRKRAGLF